MFRFLSLSLILALSVTARADDLRDILERDKIAAQKVMSEVIDALSQSKAFENADPARAKQALEGALTKITNSTVMAADQRNALEQRVRARLAEVNRLARAQDLANEEAAKRTADKLKKERQTNAPESAKTTETAKKYIQSTQDQVTAAQRTRPKAKGTLGVFIVP